MKHRLFQAATTTTEQSESSVQPASHLSTASDKGLQNFKRIGMKHFSSTGMNLLACTQQELFLSPVIVFSSKGQYGNSRTAVSNHLTESLFELANGDETVN